MFDAQAAMKPFEPFTSHKQILAAKITKIHGPRVVGIGPDHESVVFEPANKPVPHVGWYVLMYPDGYVSFSPPDQFEKGYTRGLVGDKPHAGLPVAGYKPQDASTVALVNLNKRHEEVVLRVLDDLASLPDTDKRWLAIGRTSIEQGFMAANRAIFKPGRVSL